MAEADWDIDLTQEGSSLSGSGKEGAFVNRSYNSQYRVLTQDATVSAKLIEDHFRRTTSLPWYGRAWKWAQGTNTDKDIESICVSIDVKHEPQSTGKFMVECKFEPKNDKTEKEKPDNSDDGDDTNDPLAWRDQVNITYVQQSFPATKGIFRGFTQGSPFLGQNDKPFAGTNKLRLGLTYVPCGSNLVPYDPLPEIEEQIKVIRFVRNIPEWDSAWSDPWIGIVNADAVTIIKKPIGFKVVIPALKGRIVSINGSSEFENGKSFWRREIEVHVHPRGWRGRYPDMGLVALPKDTDDGWVSPGDLINKPRQTEQISMKDDEGTPTPSPLLLDGFGRPLRVQDIDRTVWTNWQFYEELLWQPVANNF